MNLDDLDDDWATVPKVTSETGWIFTLDIYIYYYIYVYGYVSIDNISYESPLTTNIPHDLGNLLKCPFGTSSKG